MGTLETMKTTVELPEELFRQVKEYAARHGMPMREVFELGLRMVVEGKPAGRRRFRLRTITTKGKGVAGDADWNTIRSLIYEGHGG
jgi:hypothetical protein